MREEASQAAAIDRRLAAKVADSLIQFRSLRHKFIDRKLLGEPVWEISLAVFVEDARGSSLKMARLASNIGQSMETTRRWVQVMVDDGLLELTGERVHMTASAADALVQYLSGMPAFGLLNGALLAGKCWSEASAA